MKGRLVMRGVALVLTLSCGLTTAGGQSGRADVSPGSAGARALAYFEKIEGRSFDEHLQSSRPARLSPELRAQVLAGLSLRDEVTPSARGRAKLAALEPILRYHGRNSEIELRVSRAGRAYIGLRSLSVLLISEEALWALATEELQAVVAHELAHEYFWNEYHNAKREKRYEDMKEIELRCDGVAIITLARLGLAPGALRSALLKIDHFNRTKMFFTVPLSHPSLPDRAKFNRAMIDLVKARLDTPLDFASK